MVLSFLPFYLNPFPSPAKDLPKIAVWDLSPGDIKPTYAQDLTLILVSEVSKLEKYEVYSQENVRTLAGWTAQRMTLGCTDAKCLTALGQMDIAKLISGRVGKIGNRYTISLNLFDTQNTKAEKSISEFCRSEDELIELVQQGVRKLLGASIEPLIPPKPEPPGKPGKKVPIHRSLFPAPASFLHDITYDGEYLWALKDNGTVYKLNTQTGAVVSSFRLIQGNPKANSSGITWDGDYLWLSKEDRYYQIDVTSSISGGTTRASVLREIIVPPSLGGRLEWDGSCFWTHDSRRIFRVSKNGEINRTLDIPESIKRWVDGGIAFDGKNLWIPVNRLAPEVRVYQIDPLTGRILRSYKQNHYDPSCSNVVGLAVDRSNSRIFNYVFPYGPIYLVDSVSLK